MSGRVQFVGAGPGAPDLITVRGLRALQAAEVVLYDALVDPSLLEGLTADLIYVGKRCGKHSRTQDQINELIAEMARRGHEVVRLKGGDPGVLGRVGEEALYLRERGIPYEIVPGVSSATSAPLCAGIPVTHRGVADSYALATAHRRDEKLGFSIPAFSPRTTLLLLMPVRTTPEWSAELLEKGYPADLPLAFITRGSEHDQAVLVTTVANAAQDASGAGITAPTMVVVGNVVALREQLRWFPDRDLSQAAQDAEPRQSKAAPAPEVNTGQLA